MLVRGFTLIEMMVVVVIIGLFAALAVPSVVSLVRDQRTRREAMNITNAFRAARARSLGRGSAVNINFTTTPVGAATRADFVTREAVSVGMPGTPPQPDPTCRGYTWTNGTLLNHYYPSLVNGVPDTQITGQTNDAVLGAPTNATYLDICYTPKGRMYTRTASNGTFQPLAGRVIFSAQRLDGPSMVPTGIIRAVLVNDDGTTRLRL
jgi:type II secretion system protein H